MKVNKLALVLALLFLFSTKVEAHGPLDKRYQKN